MAKVISIQIVDQESGKRSGAIESELHVLANLLKGDERLSRDAYVLVLFELFGGEYKLSNAPLMRLSSFVEQYSKE